ncbi:MAG: hypothetical protein R3F13_16935 [Prosthecobacter sp.]
MLSEYALIPDVFDPAGYASAETCDKHLRELKEGIIARGLVRNLHGGGWWRFVETHRDRWDKRGRELLKKLKQQGRLSEATGCAVEAPEAGLAWCAEALASHEQVPLAGVISDEVTAAEFTANELVAPVPRLTEQTWWTGGKNSIELKRTTDDYLEALGPTLRHSNSIWFVDPHLDPDRPDYRGFSDLLRACGPRKPAARIQIHRVCYSGSGRERQIITADKYSEWENRFRNTLGTVVREADLKVEVFFWDDFHDRYLISNLIGILMPNGFDTDAEKPVTRWARLDRDHRDSVEREFDEPSSRHKLRHRFSI